MLNTRMLRARVLWVLSLALLAVWVGVEAGVTRVIQQTERAAWQGRQQEAAQNAARTIADFIQNKELSLDLVDYVVEADASTRSRVLTQILEQDPTIEELVIVDRDARVVALAARGQPMLANQFSLRLARWFQQTSQGKPYLGSVQISSKDQPYLVMARPATDQYLVAARLQMDIFWQVVRDIHFGKTGRVYITGLDGRLIAHTNTELIEQYSTIAGRSEFESALQAGSHAWQGEYRNFTGQPVVGFSAAVPNSEWIVFTELARSEAYESSRNAFVFIFFGMLVLIALVAWVSRWAIDRSVTTPVAALSQGVERVTQGDLSQPIGLRSDDEIGRVAQAFDAMAEQLRLKYTELQAAQTDLELRVEQRTQDLARANQALQVSEERYALAVQGANDGLWDWDLRTNAVYFSPRCKTMLGYAEEEVQNDPLEWICRIHPDDMDSVEASLKAHLNDTQCTYTSEHRLLNKDGHYQWVLVRGTAVRDGENRPYRIAGSMTDMSYRKSMEEQLVYTASHDALSGLPNRANFLEQLRQMLERMRRRLQNEQSYLGAVLFLDIDRFKAVNDTLGHAMGDRLLIQISERLAQCIRTGDMVARFGGDEFAILLDDIHHITDATHIASRVQEEISTPFLFDQSEVFVSASIGIAMVNEASQTADELLRDADIAMYRAKSNGKARYEIFDRRMHAAAVERMALEADLRQAIERNELQVWYQPIARVSDRQITSLEALVRWQHPRRGLLLPETFLETAEDTGLLIPVGMWVLRSACQQLAVWRAAGYRQVSLSVNFSTRQLQDAGLVSRVAQIIAETQIPAEMLELEIPEAFAIHNCGQPGGVLAQLHALGVQLSVHNFGAGNAYLSYLRNAPISTLKIDRSYTGDYCETARNSAIPHALIAMARALRLRVVAEGVETAEQSAYLAEHHCDEMQGYFLSPPLTAGDMFAMLGH